MNKWRNSMKKFNVLVVLIAVMIMLAGCASKPEQTETAAVEEAAPVETVASYTELEMPAGEAVLMDNFEEGNFWYAVADSWDQWGSHNLSLTAELSSSWGTDGGTSLECVYDIAGPATSMQASFCCDQPLETDWTGAKFVVMDINNVEKHDVQLNVAVQATDGWTWTQSADLVFPPGEHLGVFAIDSFAGLEAVKRMIINVTGENPGGTVLIDNYRVIY